MLVTPQQPTAHEQLLLELTNRLRMSPSLEFGTLIQDAATGQGVQGDITDALRFFGVDVSALRSQLATEVSVAPLAWNSALASAAEDHTLRLIAADAQSHQLPGQPALTQRVTAAGYTGWSALTENVYSYAQNALHAHAAFVIDWGYDSADLSGGNLRPDWQTIGDGIQDPAGHRASLLNPGMTEIGIAMLSETNPATGVGPWLITQDLGSRWNYAPQLLGVVTDDADGDRFYDIGEGIAGVTVTAKGAAGQFTTVTWGSGGYQMVLPAGSYTVTYEGGGISGVVTHRVTIGGSNVKQDAFAGDARSDPDMRLIGTAAAEALTGLGGNDTISGDGFRALDALPQSQQIWRLYQATLDRAPDPPGHADWTARLAEGRETLNGVVRGFVNSSEFQATYGILTDRAFITLLYQNVLDRAPDAVGLASWVDRMTGGLSRAEVVLGFSESREFTNRTLTAANDYAMARDQAGWSDDVYRLYRATLDRAPDASGFDYWTDRLADGAALVTAVDGFVGSREFQRTYGALDNQAFVTLLYRNVLERAPDAAGLAAWLDRLEGGATRSEVVLGFAQSREFIADTSADLKAFIRSLGPHDTIQGGGGTNMLSGGRLDDIFVFVAGTAAQDRVTDLEPWDHLSFQGFGYDDPGDIRARLAQSGTDVVFSDQGVTVTLANTQLAQLTDDMFVF